MMAIDPTWTVGLLSADYGSVYSADGREHPVLGMTPVYPVAPSVPSVPDVQQAAAVSDPIATNASLGGLLSLFTPKHAIARIVIAILGIGLVFIVALRLTR